MVVDAAIASGWDIAGLVGVANDAPQVLGHPVSLSPDGIGFDRFIVAIGRNDLRARRFAEYLDAGHEPGIVIHPSAVIAPSAVLGRGTFVAAGAIINPEARVGDNVIVNTSCVVEHDVIVGDHVLLGPTSSLCGGVSIGEGVLFGAAASAIPGVSVGAWSECGAGAVVVSDLPGRTLCVGVPARPLRPIDVSR